MAYFGEIQSTILKRAPKFLRRRQMASLLEAAALIMDGAVDNLKAGFRLSNPRLADASALPYLSHDRSLKIYPTEPEASQRFRLSQWWQLHKQRGSHQGEMRHLQPYFLGTSGTDPLPRIRAVHQCGGGSPVATWHTLTGTYDTNGARHYSAQRIDPSNYNFDGQVSHWSRWWVFIEVRDVGFSIPGVYNDGHTWNDGALYDVGSTKTITSAMALDMIAMLRHWKAAHSRLSGVALVWKVGGIDPTATPTMDPSGWWNLPGNGEWANVAKRPPYISWIYLNP